MRAICLLLLLSIVQAQALTDVEIQQFIDEAIKAGGGEVVIPQGTHEIRKSLLIKDAKNLRLIGLDQERCILKLPPASFAQSSVAVAAGVMSIATLRQQGIVPGMTLQIEAPGEMDTFTQKPRSSFRAVVAAVTPDTITLTAPLAFPVPEGTLLRDVKAPNLIEIRGLTEGLWIEKLTLDGGKVEGDPKIHGHVQLCGIFASGPYSYEKGPTGPPVKGVQVSRCIIQNCHGRGIAFYSVEGASVTDSTIMDTTDEAIDLDHFTTKSLVRHNHIARCGVGVELNDANDCQVIGNDFLNCGLGIHLWQYCKQPGLNEGNVIRDNVFDGMEGARIKVQSGLTKNEIEGL
ncbi:MAG: right-handed parallel beta-helix repeat-containing protein [Verrucomicrobiales bacterium]|nr:right-handed parallel beta-helix repeat-containing protein [Verrucomicrobiales bacterium]MCP5558494.1 right-handed parallel beta-helix repeat-containing protein [Verrucomicrobiaceae bacterium]